MRSTLYEIPFILFYQDHDQGLKVYKGSAVIKGHEPAKTYISETGAIGRVGGRPGYEVSGVRFLVLLEYWNDGLTLWRGRPPVPYVERASASAITYIPSQSIPYPLLSCCCCEPSNNTIERKYKLPPSGGTF